ncbi:phage/plasmid primase, P4 family [Cytobacillus firmus]|uniref:phage/plasmid primase, P4 family n=1 Tax=Cytobacillus firmus TaxID=1399 RepID=UPI001C8D618B|nr:phage/plasmid primase, P4 family [Cytobacillus firmus]MBX9974206.1 DNA primase [Cytobacillus firmus]
MEASEAAKYVEYLDNEKFAANNAAIADTPKYFKTAGKKLEDDEVIIDIDTLPIDVIKKLISFFNIKTELRWTDRGVHMWFKKPKGYKHKAAGVCALGFEAEWKISKTTKSVTVKRNGVLRPIENEGVREPLPDFLTYLKGAENLFGLQDGDGRNKKLHSHKFKVIHMRDPNKYLRFINDSIFSVPLEDNEFSIVTRDEKINSDKNSPYEVAMQIKKKLKVVKYGNLLYSYDGICYRTDNFKHAVANEIKGQSMRYINEILCQIDLYTEPIEEPLNGWVIKFKNGCLYNGKWCDVDYQGFTPYYIHIPYYPEAEPVQIVDEYIDHLTDNNSAYRKRLLETLAHTLIVNKDFKRMLAKFFIIVGGGGNGKGTLLRIITEILGQKNVTSLSIKQMADERYFVTMQGKLANLGDDIEDEYISKEQIKMLKNVSTCDRIQIRRLGEQSFDVELTCSLIFTSNHILKSREKGDSYKRRVDWLPMDKKPTKKDPDFIQKLTTDLAKQYWIRLILEAYKRLHENKGFTESKIVSNFNEEYHRINNHILDFFENKQKEYFIQKGKLETFREYKQWCEDNEEYPLGKEKFHAQLLEHYELDYGKMTFFKGKIETSTTCYKLKKGTN